MVFNSLVYVAFLAVVLPLVHALPRRAQNVVLVAASYLFYGWWDGRFLLLIALSTAVDFVAAQRIADARSPAARKLALAVSIAMNLGILGFFKYFDFFVDTALAALEVAGLPIHTRVLEIVLPVGISFYTFQTMAYTIDVYRGRMQPTRDPWAFALYVAFFPQLVAGPIERAQRLLPQLEADRTLSPLFLRTGVTLLITGWFKKVGLGDGVAPFVDEIFAEPAAYSGSSLLLGVALFMIQLYGDFSGYSDLARGSARLLGVDLMVNFDRPYLSQNIGELWRRWHVSLSSWFMDYVYVPMGGSRCGPVRNAVNLIGVFTISGLWHGAGWNFVLWGFVNGVAMYGYRLWSTRPGASTEPVALGSPRWFVGNALTLGIFGFALLIFLAHGLAGVWTILHAVVLNPFWIGYERLFLVNAIAFAVPLVALDLLQTRSGTEEPTLTWSRPAQGALLAATVVWVLVLGSVDVDVPFIYFQF